MGSVCTKTINRPQRRRRHNVVGRHLRGGQAVVPMIGPSAQRLWEMATPSELAVAMAQEPGWTLPPGCGDRDKRMDEARELIRREVVRGIETLAQEAVDEQESLTVT